MLRLHSPGNTQEEGVGEESRDLCIQDIWGPIFVVLLLSSINESSWCSRWNTLSFGILGDRRGCGAAGLQPACNPVRNRAIAMRRHAHRLIGMHSHSSQPPTLLRNSTAAGANYRQTNSAFSGSSLKTVNPPYHEHYHPDQPLGVV